MRRGGRAALLLTLAVLVWVVPGAAQEVDGRALELLGAPTGPALTGIELDLATERVASRMRCPVCQGLSVADSHTESAQAMRSRARELLAAGYDADQVLTYFESSYGEFIRLSPRPEGFNLVVWILPAAGLLIGLLVVRARLRRSRATADAGPASQSSAAAPDAPASGADDLAAYRERVRREAAGRPRTGDLSEEGR